MNDIRERIQGAVGRHLAERVFEILNEEGTKPCRDTDCIRLRPHRQLSTHVWRHVPVAPLSPGLFGRRCLTCGQPTWRRIHKTGREQ